MLLMFFFIEEKDGDGDLMNDRKIFFPCFDETKYVGDGNPSTIHSNGKFQNSINSNEEKILNKVNDKFIIMSGSELAYEVTSSYRYTASDIRRKKFIQLNCGSSKNDYTLKRDAICNSPDEAACFVLGDNLSSLFAQTGLAVEFLHQPSLTKFRFLA